MTVRSLFRAPASRRRIRAALVAGGTLLAGCMIGPDFKPPAAPVASDWLEAHKHSVSTDREEYRDWWSVLNDPVLTHLIELAYQQNLTLRAAGTRVLQSRAQLGVAIGELYPQQQQVSAALSYNRIPITVPYNLINNTYWQALFGAQAGWEIDVWGKVRRGIESADDAYLASVAEYDDVLVTLTADVANAYVDIRTVETQLGIANDNIEKQRKALAIAEARYHGGVVSKRDVYQAENVLGSTEAAVPQLTIELNKAKNALAVLLGLPPGPLDELLGESTTIPVAPDEVAVGIPADLLRRRPDIRSAELRAAAQCAQIGFAKGDLLPAFSLLGNVGTLSTDIGHASLGKVFTGNTLAYSVGPTVQWNILNYGQITNNVRVQDAGFQQLLVDYQNAVLKAQQEVENGISAFVYSRDQVTLLQESVVAAQGALRIAIIQYKDGTTDFTTVLNAEQDLYQAENNLALARGNIVLGLVGAYRALGGGWQIREGGDFVPSETREEMAARTNWGGLLTPDLLRPQAPGLPSTADQGPLVRPPEW